MWCVYILECKNQAFYTGITKDLARRFKEHCSGSSRYTRTNPPVKILYSEPQPTRSHALKREAQIKKWPRSEKIALIKKISKARKRINRFAERAQKSKLKRLVSGIPEPASNPRQDAAEKA